MTDTTTQTEGVLARLPYTLTKGVTATREGIIFVDDIIADGIAFLCDAQMIVSRWPWPDAAERLRYREGEPYCADHGVSATFMMPPIEVSSTAMESFTVLHRLAAILCDDAEAFRVLHWCINNLA